MTGNIILYLFIDWYLWLWIIAINLHFIGFVDCLFVQSIWQDSFFEKTEEMSLDHVLITEKMEWSR